MSKINAIYVHHTNVNDCVRCMECNQVNVVNRLRHRGYKCVVCGTVLTWQEKGSSDRPVLSSAKLTENAKARKDVPLCTGCLDYFPDALADVARLSKIGNDKHNPGEPLHWSRGKSADHADCILRHQMDRGVVDTDGVLHDAKVAWRALAQLQLTIEKLRGLGLTYPPEDKS